jgi:hypothetical protein
MDEETLPGSRDSRQPRSSERRLEFITFTNPEMARTRANQQRVRSQAMRDFHRRSDAPRRRRNEIELDIGPLLQRSAQNDETLLDVEQSGDHQASSSLITALNISRLEPFFQYPIRMGYRERELYDHRTLTRFSFGRV